jgi:hypothetical protein
LRLLCLSFLITISSMAFAQPQGPDTLWTRNYDSPNGGGMVGRSVLCNSDGSILVSGTFENTASIDLYVVKLDEHGDSVWFRAYGQTGSGEDAGGLLCRAQGGGYALAGSYPVGQLSEDFYLARLNDDGDLLWERVYPSPNADDLKCIASTRDGGFVLGGSTNVPELLRVDAAGDTVWRKQYRFTTYGSIYAVAQDAEGDFLATGEAFGSGDSSSLFVLRLDSLGNAVSLQNFGGQTRAWGNDVVATRDGGWFFTGLITSSMAPWKCFVIKETVYGDTQWTRIYGNDGDEMGTQAVSWPDSSYTILNIYGAQSNWGFELVRLDRGGEIAWRRFYRTSSNWMPHAAFATDNLGRDVMVGSSGIYHLAVIKTKTDHDFTVERTPSVIPLFLGMSVYPNPFNSATTISLTLPFSSHNITLTTFNLLGQVVREDHLPAAVGQVVYHYDASALASGIYLLRAEAGTLSQTTKLVVMK